MWLEYLLSGAVKNGENESYKLAAFPRERGAISRVLMKRAPRGRDPPPSAGRAGMPAERS